MLLGARLEDEESDKDSRAVAGSIMMLRMDRSMTMNDCMVEENCERKKSTSSFAFCT